MTTKQLEQVPTDQRYRDLPGADRAPRFLAVGGVLLALGFAMAVVMIVWVTQLDASDRPVGVWFFDASHRWGLLEGYGDLFQRLGSGNVTTPVAFAFMVALAIGRRWNWLWWLIAVSLGGLLISEGLKNFIQRERPTWANPLFTETGYSFPSGHTLSGVTSWVAMGIVLLFILPKPTSTVVGWIVIAIGLLMGPSRLFLGVHWVTDVLASLMLGFGWLLVVSGFFLWRGGRLTAQAASEQAAA